MQDLFKQVFFCRSLTKFKDFYTFTILGFNLYVLRMGRWIVPHVKDNKLSCTQKTVSLDIDEEYARERQQGNF